MSDLITIDIGDGDEEFLLVGSTSVDQLGLIILRRPDTMDVLMLCVDEDGGLSPLIDEEIFHKAFINWGMNRMIQNHINIIEQVSETLDSNG